MQVYLTSETQAVQQRSGAGKWLLALASLINTAESQQMSTRGRFQQHNVPICDFRRHPADKSQPTALPGINVG